MDRDEVDGALARLGAEADRMAQSLLAMDDHPGHPLLDAADREAVAALWAAFAAHRQVLDRARGLRAGRPGAADLTALTGLLTGPSVELDGESGPAERVTPDELVERMRAGYARVVDALAAAVARHAAAEALARELVGLRAEAHRLRDLVEAKIAVTALPPVPDTVAGCRELVANLAGLLDRRTELRGRLEAYRAKATRLGHAEDPTLSALHRDAHDVLFTAPCDLPEATRAVGRYQRAVLDLVEA